MKSHSSQHLYEYFKNGDGQILYDITKQWRENMGGKTENEEYKEQYREIISGLGGTHLISRLKKEVSIDCKYAELRISKTPGLTPAYFLSIKIKPALSEEDERKARPVLDKMCKQAILLLVDFRKKMIEDAMNGKPGIKL